MYLYPILNPLSQNIMSISEEELKDRYSLFTDDELLRLWNKNTLTDLAQIILRKELQNRGITPPELNDLENIEINEDIDPWVTVERYSSAFEAHLLRGRLESEDIPAVLADEHIISANWFLSNAIGGVRVRVPYSYIEQAAVIINEHTSGKYEISDEEAEERLCPKCRSDNIIQYRSSWKAALLIFYFFNLPVPFSLDKYKCETCRHIWKENK